MLEARYTQSLPVSTPLAVTRTLPSDKGNTSPVRARSRRAPAPGMVVARLEAPSVQLSTAVLEGSDDATLNRAAGHIEDTALPGQLGNIGIAGHRDTVFRPLRRMRVGDTMDLSTRDRVYRYRINKTLIVSPKDVYVLKPTAQPTLTLVTCYPFEFVGHAPRRFVVQATLVGQEGLGTRD
jgi:sortase A